MPSEASLDAWVKLVRAQRSTLGGIEAALRAAGLPPLAWYDVLLELRRRPQGLRLVELEKRLLLAQYNVSRLVERIAAAGYLEKRTDEADRRAKRLRLTAAGGSLLTAMWPVYRAAVEARIGNRLTDEETRRLTALLGKLAESPD